MAIHLSKFTGSIVSENGKTTQWYADGRRHRVGAPAVESACGHREWFQMGKRHRDDGPAVEWPNGLSEWHHNGLLHRSNGPAFIFPDGTQHWYANGLLHRMDGPAVEKPDGTALWYRNGQLCLPPGQAVATTPAPSYAVPDYEPSTDTDGESKMPAPTTAPNTASEIRRLVERIATLSGKRFKL